MSSAHPIDPVLELYGATREPLDCGNLNSIKTGNRKSGLDQPVARCLGLKTWLFAVPLDDAKRAGKFTNAILDTASRVTFAIRVNYGGERAYAQAIRVNYL